jgi:hypothetical protein
MIRMIQVKNADSLSKLLKAGTAAGPALQRIKDLNPHVGDLAQLKPGTVLLLPDGPDFEAGEGDSVAGEVFDGFAADASAGLKASSERLRAGMARRDAMRKDVAAVLKTAAIKRALETDPALRKQADDADARFKAEQKEGTAALATLSAMDEALVAELANLAKVFK